MENGAAVCPACGRRQEVRVTVERSEGNSKDAYPKPSLKGDIALWLILSAAGFYLLGFPGALLGFVLGLIFTFAM